MVRTTAASGSCNGYFQSTVAELAAPLKPVQPDLIRALATDVGEIPRQSYRRDNRQDASNTKSVSQQPIRKHSTCGGHAVCISQSSPCRAGGGAALRRPRHHTQATM